MEAEKILQEVPMPKVNISKFNMHLLTYQTLLLIEHFEEVAESMICLRIDRRLEKMASD